MKKSLLSLILLVGLAEAGDSTIGTELTNHCEFSQGVVGVRSAIDFGSINPLLKDGEKIKKIMQLNVTCTKETPFTVNFTSINNWELKKGSDSIPYHIYAYHYNTEEDIKTLHLTGRGKHTSTGDRGLFIIADKSMKPGSYADTITTTFSW